MELIDPTDPTNPTETIKMSRSVFPSACGKPLSVARFFEAMLGGAVFIYSFSLSRFILHSHVYEFSNSILNRIYFFNYFTNSDSEEIDTKYSGIIIHLNKINFNYSI